MVIADVRIEKRIVHFLKVNSRLGLYRWQAYWVTPSSLNRIQNLLLENEWLNRLEERWMRAQRGLL